MSAIRIYCDGACSGNPGPGGWGAIVATPDGRVRELGGGKPATTNNQMEITAAIAALESVQGVPGEVWIFTDSTYVIQGITKWIWGWRQRNWQTAEGKPVANRELWEKLSSRILARGKTSPVKWNHVKGHAGHAANERADAIAVAYAKRAPIALYDGTAAAYGFALDDALAPLVKKTGNGKSVSAKATAYLSLLDGKPVRHKTWATCEQRVKGKSGARYRKATSADEERAIWREWGVDPSAVSDE